MDIEYLNEFCTIAETLNYTKAALILHSTQSTLSKHMAALENEFKAEFFRRSRSGVTLTEAGTMLYHRARLINDLYADAKSDIHTLMGNTRVRIGGLMNNGEVMRILSRTATILASNGQQRFDFSPLTSHSILTSLTKGEIDIVLCNDARETHTEEGLVKLPLLRTPFIAIVESTHPLANRPSIKMTDLEPFAFVQLLDEACKYGWANIEHACQRHGFTPRKHPFIANSVFDCLMEPLDDDVLILQRYLIPVGISINPGYRCIPIDDKDAAFELCAYYREQDRKALAGIIDVIRQVCDEMRDEVSQPMDPREAYPFLARCRILAQCHDLDETQAAALVAFVKGRRIELIAESLGMTRLTASDLLADVFKQLEVNDVKELMDAIEAVELP